MTGGPTSLRNAHSISIFDLDRTLTRRPTYSLFLFTAAAAHAPLRLLFAPAVLVAMALHVTGLLSRKRLKELMHALLLGRRLNAGRLEKLAAAFVDQLLAGGLYADGLAQLNRDREQGRLLVLATAAPDYYAGAIGKALRFHATISTRYQRDADDVLARIGGRNCRGPDKLCALRSWLDEHGLARGAIHVRVYSDDRSDIPALEWADEPIVVNARPTMAALARSRGWAVMSWR